MRGLVLVSVLVSVVGCGPRGTASGPTPGETHAEGRNREDAKSAKERSSRPSRLRGSSVDAMDRLALEQAYPQATGEDAEQIALRLARIAEHRGRLKEARAWAARAGDRGAELLRVLDRQEVRRVGSNHPIKVEVRVLAATRRDLDKAIAAGQFRDDLYHRLAVARIEVPALRQRHGDVSLLSRAFAREFAIKELPQSLLAKFEEYSWPGNVRELRNAIARYAALGEHSLEELSHESVRSGASSGRRSSHDDDAAWLEAFFQLPFAIARRKVQDEFSRRYVERVFEEHNGSVTLAARASGVALRYFRLVKARSRR
ncbi:MAG TPA: sigma 54-interacting transcriptional regulator [Kofleriaceae bacterium]|nr:sigma 54-interacting transcriptional regulator [Kofleriaceae bacterium]